MIYHLFQYSNLLPIICGLALWRILPKSLRIITLIPLADFLAEYGSEWAKYSMGNNLWFFNQYRVVQLLLITWYFSSLFENLRWRRISWITAALLALFGEITTFWVFGWDHYNTLFFVVSGAFYISLSMGFFIQVLRKFPVVGLEKNPHFFINTGLFVFFCVAFVAFTTLALFLHTQTELWMVFRISRIFRNIFLAIGLLVFYFSWKNQTASRLP